MFCILNFATSNNKRMEFILNKGWHFTFVSMLSSQFDYKTHWHRTVFSVSKIGARFTKSEDFIKRNYNSLVASENYL